MNTNTVLFYNLLAKLMEHCMGLFNGGTTQFLFMIPFALIIIAIPIAIMRSRV